MKQKYFLILSLVLTTHLLVGQETNVDKIISTIDLKQDTIRAVYDWITENIAYDVTKFNKIKRGKDPVGKKLDSKEAYYDFMLEEVIKKKKGVCQDYSILFDRIVKRLGYKTEIITGFTKGQKGDIKRKTGHTWNTVYLDGEWKLYDVTWGAGQVKNGNKFIRKPTDRWYEVAPEVLLEDHLPFDPMWQLLDKPISLEEFARAKTVGTKVEAYDFMAMINEYLVADNIKNAEDALIRSKLTGNGGAAIVRWRKSLEKELANNESSNQYDDLTSLTARNTVVYDRFNQYSKARRNNFKDKLWTLTYSLEALEEIEVELEDINTSFLSMKIKNKNNKKTMRKTVASNKKLLRTVAKEKKTLKEQF